MNAIIHHSRRSHGMALLRIYFLAACLFTFVSSTSAQLSWNTRVTNRSAHLNAIAFFDTNMGIAVGNDVILRSIDGGISWASVFEKDFSSFKAVIIVDSTTAVAATGGGCFDFGCGEAYRSSDRGITWENVSELGIEGMALSLRTPSSLLLVGGGYLFSGAPYGGVYFSDDAGLSWDILPNSSMSQIIVDITSVSSNLSLAVASNIPVYVNPTWIERSSIFRLSDTLGWLLTDTLWDGSFSKIHLVDSLNGGVVGNNGLIWWTTDGGGTWIPQSSNTSNSLNAIQVISPSDAYAVGSSGTILHTVDSGLNWTMIASNTSRNLKDVFILDSTHGWIVGEYGTLLKYGRFSTCVVQQIISFDVVPRGGHAERRVSIANDGTDTLLVTGASSNISIFSVSDAPPFVLPGKIDSLTISFDPSDTGFYSGQIIITSNAHSSPDSIMVFGTAGVFDTTVVRMNARWNLVSVPRDVQNDSVHILFPQAEGEAYFFVSGIGYQTSKRMQNGIGYWIKITDSTQSGIAGFERNYASVEIVAGWNLIGGLSADVSVSSIVTSPPGIVVSPFYGFNNGYEAVSILEPGRGYWVKADSPGQILLSVLSGNQRVGK